MTWARGIPTPSRFHCHAWPGMSLWIDRLAVWLSAGTQCPTPSAHRCRNGLCFQVDADATRTNQSRKAVRNKVPQKTVLNSSLVHLCSCSVRLAAWHQGTLRRLTIEREETPRLIPYLTCALARCTLCVGLKEGGIDCHARPYPSATLV